MDSLNLYVKVVEKNGKIIVKHCVAPTKSDWELFFNNLKKKNLFLAKNSPHAEMMLTSGVVKLCTGKETLLLADGMVIDGEDEEKINKIIPIIKANAIKLRSM